MVKVKATLVKLGDHASIRTLMLTANSITRTFQSALLGALLCAACASHHLPQKERLEADLEAMQLAVSVKVPDAQRAARLNKSINDLGQQMLAFQTLGNKFQSEFRTLNSRRTAARAEFETLIKGYDKQRRDQRAHMFELHSQLIEATTAEEWKGLFPYERALLTD
jgi:hypothetical protein